MTAGTELVGIGLCQRNSREQFGHMTKTTYRQRPRYSTKRPAFICQFIQKRLNVFDSLEDNVGIHHF